MPATRIFALVALSCPAFNMGQRSQYVSIRRWPQRMAEWLEDRGYLKAH